MRGQRLKFLLFPRLAELGFHSGHVGTHPQAGFAFWLKQAFQGGGVGVAGHGHVWGPMWVEPGVGQGVSFSF